MKLFKNELSPYSMEELDSSATLSPQICQRNFLKRSIIYSNTLFGRGEGEVSQCVVSLSIDTNIKEKKEEKLRREKSGICLLFSSS